MTADFASGRLRGLPISHCSLGSVQARQLVDRLADSVAQQSQPSNGTDPVQSEPDTSGASAAVGVPAVLLCGDFNAEPQSAELQVPNQGIVWPAAILALLPPSALRNDCYGLQP